MLLSEGTADAAHPAAKPNAEPITLLPYNFLEQRLGHQTRLLVRGPAPQAYKAEQPPPGVERVAYASSPCGLRTATNCFTACKTE